MVGDFQWQENLKTLCEYVASKIWFNRCSALPNSLVAIVKNIVITVGISVLRKNVLYEKSQNRSVNT